MVFSPHGPEFCSHVKELARATESDTAVVVECKVLSPPSASPHLKVVKGTSAYNQEKEISKVKSHRNDEHLDTLLVLCPRCLGIHLRTPKAAGCEHL